MLVRRNLLYGKRKYLYGMLLFTFISLLYLVFGMTDGDDFAISRREILLRRIGHELLLQSGDSTSRVLPVKKIAENEYQISFERELTFQADSLVNTTQRLLAKDPLADDYVVNVLDGNKSGVTYGYAVSKNKKDDIVTCIGRKQPIAPYLINIRFKPVGTNAVKIKFLIGSLPILAFVGFIFLGAAKPRKVLPDPGNTDMFTLGSMLFDTAARRLTINGKTVALTRTETHVLRIFALSPNEAIARNQLQKEIWEDEGVIVGRSLDMFISKLRKKLEPDPNVKIVVIRGKGYKLEISA